MAERLRALVEAHPLEVEGRSLSMTVSIGVALASTGDTAQTALQRADAAMYAAKERGRNRVEISQLQVQGACVGA